MRAVLYREQGGLDRLQVADVPAPEIGPGEALVRVRSCGVNRLDLLVRSGRTPVKPPLPHIPGSEVAGEVAALGALATGSAVGQPVVIAPYLSCGQCEFCLSGEEVLCLRGDILGLISNGGYAEYVKAPASHLVPIPAGVAFDEAAAVTLSTLAAWHMLVARAKLQPGEDVLVLAAGSGVGSAAVQIAKAMGARVIATASTAEKLARAKELGADITINYREQDFAQVVRQVTGKRGVDVVVEHVGAETWERSVGCLARKGRLVTCGATTGSQGNLDIWTLFAKETQIIGSYGGTRGELRQVLKLVASGTIKPVIYRRYPLAEAREAQRAMEEREQFGKLVLNP